MQSICLAYVVVSVSVHSHRLPNTFKLNIVGCLVYHLILKKVCSFPRMQHSSVQSTEVTSVVYDAILYVVNVNVVCRHSVSQ